MCVPIVLSVFVPCERRSPKITTSLSFGFWMFFCEIDKVGSLLSVLWVFRWFASSFIQAHRLNGIAHPAAFAEIGSLFYSNLFCIVDHGTSSLAFILSGNSHFGTVQLSATMCAIVHRLRFAAGWKELSCALFFFFFFFFGRSFVVSSASYAFIPPTQNLTSISITCSAVCGSDSLYLCLMKVCLVR